MTVSDLYWNSHKKLFSVRQHGKVIGHHENVYIDLPSFIVSEAGRQRVLASGSKNVHAFVRGEMTIKERIDGKGLTEDTKKAHWNFYRENVAHSDYSFAVYNPYDECGKFRVLCVIGDIVIRDSNWDNGIKMVHAYVQDNKPRLKVKIS